MGAPSTASWCSTRWTALQSPTYNVTLPPAAPMSLSPGSMALSELFSRLREGLGPQRTGGVNLSCWIQPLTSVAKKGCDGDCSFIPRSLQWSVLYAQLMLQSGLEVERTSWSRRPGEVQHPCPTPQVFCLLLVLSTLVFLFLLGALKPECKRGWG